MQQTLLRELESIETIIAAIEKRTKVAPKGKLRLSNSHGRRQYRRVSPGEDEYLSSKKDMAEIRALAQKDYDAKVLKVALREKCHLEQLMSLASIGQKESAAELSTAQEAKARKKGDPTPLLTTTRGPRPLKIDPLTDLTVIKAVYEALPEERKTLVIPAVWPDEEYAGRWLQSLPADAEISRDACIYSTDQGEMVRSKSEVIIANKLHAAGVPYLYERPLELGSRTVHPDFVVLNPATRQEWVWEHFGMMDNADYLQGALQKLKLYAQYGLTPGRGLVVTFESSASPLDVAAVDGAVADVMR